MVENATNPETGSGPYGVEHSEEDSFYYVTLHGVRTGKSYPIGKTAYRAVRKLNDDDAARGITPSGAFLEDEPKPAKVTRNPGSKPKAPAPAPKGERVPRDPERKAVTPRKPVVVVAEAAPGPLEFSKVFEGTREQWLNAFTDKAREVFKQRGHELPDKIRVSVGFMFRSPKAIGQCWAESASADGHREVFINPTQADSARIADILTHELCHTLFGPEEKHGKNFKAAVTALGLEGKATATVAGDNWREWAFPILRELGSIPHAALDPQASGVKKQSTRLLKGECEDCGFIFRATAKWLNGKSLQCPDADCNGFVCVAGDEEGE